MNKVLFFVVLIFCFNCCSLNKLPVSASDTDDEFYDEKNYEDSEVLHYVFIRLDSKEFRERKGGIQNLNNDIGLTNLRVTGILLRNRENERENYLLIRRFENVYEAKMYVDLIRERSLIKSSAEIFVFSQEEYREYVKHQQSRGI